MSTWIDINKQDDVDFDHIGDTIDVCMSCDRFGNNYVSIPVKFILKALKDKGYEIKDT